jgi:hypothetical protein
MKSSHLYSFAPHALNRPYQIRHARLWLSARMARKKANLLVATLMLATSLMMLGWVIIEL